MSAALPLWVVSDAESVEQEARPYRGLSPEERAVYLVMACRAAAILLSSREDREHVLGLREPLPQSTRRAMARLMKQARRKQAMVPAIEAP